MNEPSELFKLGQHYFQTTIAYLQPQGISVSPTLTLCAADDLLCYYHVNRQVIYLSLPDRDTPQGKLQLLLLRSLLACDTNEEVFRLLRLTLHWLVVHEIAHHLRHHYGLLSVNVWQEEQIANQLAIAISKPRFSVDERAECHWLLQRAAQNLVTKLEPGSSATDSYHHLVHSLHVAGLMTRQTVEQVERMHAQTGILCETILRTQMVETPSDIQARIRSRHQIIKRTNLATKHNIVRHLYYYFGWLHIGLMSSETSTLQDFAYRYLDQPREINC